jgi:hypothetical protein
MIKVICAWDLEAPVLAVAAGYASLLAYWILRVVATNSASYRALADLMGAPSRVERATWPLILAAGAIFVLFRLLV